MQALSIDPDRDPAAAPDHSAVKPFVTRVSLVNYKSIPRCDVRLGSLMLLVGPNGAGKSNFLDALRFTKDALRTSLDHALRERGGINEVRRRSGGHPTDFGIRIDFRLGDSVGHYSFTVGAKKAGGYAVKREKCVVGDSRPFPQHYFDIVDGQASSSKPVIPATPTDRLALVAFSGLDEFRPVFDAFSHMGFYNLNPDRIRDLQTPDAGDVLARDGSNIASVLTRLRLQEPEVKARIEVILGKIVEGVRGVNPRPLEQRETIRFRQVVPGRRDPWEFSASNMSDGTLRALGILVALNQGTGPSGSPRVPLVGIEEPETALNPGAAGVLLDALRAASEHTQVLVTSHSPDLLDDESIESDSLLAVTSDSGATQIAPIDSVGRSALQDRLYTAGELFRMQELRPDPAAVPSAARKQLHLFDDNPEP